jgi:hypothetical protein
MFSLESKFLLIQLKIFNLVIKNLDIIDLKDLESPRSLDPDPKRIHHCLIHEFT